MTQLLFFGFSPLSVANRSEPLVEVFFGLRLGGANIIIYHLAPQSPVLGQGFATPKRAQLA